MHAIGHAGDRDFVLGHARPYVFPQPAAHFAVEFAHAVGMTTQTQGENGHAKGIVRIYSRLTEGEEFVERNTELDCEISEIFSHHLARERIVSGRDWCVGGEYIGRGRHLHGSVEIQLLLRDQQPDALEGEEG